MLKTIMNKFLILHDVRGVMVIRQDGEIIEGIKSGIDYDDRFTDSRFCPYGGFKSHGR